MCGDSRTWCSSTAEVGGLNLIVFLTNDFVWLT